MGNSLLKIEDLYVSYQTENTLVHAVNGVSLAIGPGETLAVVGETGAGKTTTMLSILRLLPDRIGQIDRGRILYKDEDLTQLSEPRMKAMRGGKISMVFQDPMTSLNPTMTVGEQIAEVVRIHNKSFTKQQVTERVGDVLELVGISRQRYRDYPHQFSGGMKQRIIIAIALACEPELLLADEPTTALDVTIQAQVLRLIKSLQERLGTAMILITHDLGVVAQTCERVAIMYAGRIIEQGTVEDIFEGGYHHPYTVGLFGSLPDLNQRAARLRSIDGLMPDPANLPSGCPFHPRCRQCMEVCRTKEPEPRMRGSHLVRCHLSKEAWEEEIKV